MKNISKILLAALSLVGASYSVIGCSTEPSSVDHDADEHVGATGQALSAAQCNYFAVNGKVQICHRTASAAHPFTVVKVSTQACVQAHAVHAGDYVAVNDPTCSGGGCLPEGAPCDATLGCCDGFSCTNGTCTPNISDHCAPSPCQNGGTCSNDANGYTCACPAGYTGTNCETEIDECLPQPCQHGQCLDAINAYQCQCDPDWGGTNCDVYQNGCDPDPCQNGGTCHHDHLDYYCDCAPGWDGTNCDQPFNYCFDGPCWYGTCANVTGGYVCTCDSGWIGTNCDVPCPAGTTGVNCAERLWYDCGANNPCTWDNINAGNYYFPAESSNQYVQCGAQLQCFVNTCPNGLKWDQSLLTCTY